MSALSPGICGVRRLSVPYTPSQSFASSQAETVSAAVQSVPEQFGISLSSIGKVIVVADFRPSVACLRAIRRLVSKSDCDVYAVIGGDAATLQAIWDSCDFLQSKQRQFALVLTLQCDSPAKLSVTYAAIGSNPLISLSNCRFMYTLSGKFAEKMSEWEAFHEVLDYYLRRFPVDTSLFSTFEAVVLPAPAADCLLHMVHFDMCLHPSLYGEIGKISRSLVMSNPHHRQMLENFSEEVSRSSFRPGHRRNCGVLGKVLAWAESGELLGKRLLAIGRGEGLQFAVSLFVSNRAASQSRL